MDADIQTAIQNSHLFIPFPYEMQDLAFLDRSHILFTGLGITTLFTPQGKLTQNNLKKIRDLINKHLPSKDKREVLRNKLLNGESLLILDNYNI